MKNDLTVAYIRRISSSGLHPDLIVSEFLQVLPNLLDAPLCVFTGTDPELSPRYHLVGLEANPRGDEIVNGYAGFFSLQRRQCLLEWFRRFPVLQDPTVIEPDFYNGGFYQNLLRVTGMHHLLWLPLRCGTRILGVLGVYRPKSSPAFSAAERELLLQVVPYPARALEMPGNVEQRYSRNVRAGMMVLNEFGDVLSVSREAEQLLALADTRRLLIERRGKQRLSQQIRRLCRDISGWHCGKSAQSGLFYLANAYGWFGFRGYSLNDPTSEHSGLIGLTVEYREPETLTILRAVRGLPLSPTQQQVAQLVAQGMSYANIGKAMHIKLTTVKDHVGKIYDKLDIGQRDELLPKLLALVS